jgi:hypothetical protein
MKALLFLIYILGLIYAALRWEYVIYFEVFAFACGGIYLIYRAVFNCLSNSRLL